MASFFKASPCSLNYSQHGGLMVVALLTWWLASKRHKTESSTTLFLLYSIGQSSHEVCLDSRGGDMDPTSLWKECQKLVASSVHHNWRVWMDYLPPWDNGTIGILETCTDILQWESFLSPPECLPYCVWQTQPRVKPTDSFIQQIFNKYLPYARYCSTYLEYQWMT